MNKTKKGISLIVLVITIIVMIILAATIVISLNNANVINSANKAVTDTDLKQVETMANLAWSDAYINANTNGERITQDSLSKKIDSLFEENKIDKSKYVCAVTTKGVTVLDATKWDFAYTATAGVWNNTRIEKGNEATGDIVAKFYKTGRKIKAIGTKLNQESEEYILKIEGTGAMPDLYFDGQYRGTGYGYQNGLASYNSAIDPLTIPNDWDELYNEQERIELEKASYIFYVTSAIIDEGITSVGKSAFREAKNLQSVELPETLVTINEKAFYNCINLTDISLPDGITNIADAAIYNCASLQSLVLPEALITLGQHSVASCKGITSITISANATQILSNTFSNNENLERIDVEADNNIYSSVDGVLYNKQKTKLIKFPENKLTIVIPNTVTSIGEFSFKKSHRIDKIVIPSNVTNIGNYAFWVCENLKNVYIEGTGYASNSSIGYYAFDLLAMGSTIYVRNSIIEGYLSSKYRTPNTTVSKTYNWTAPTN